MILKKVIVDGKVIYEPISFDDALKYGNVNDLEFTDEDERDEFEDRLDELEELEDEEDYFEDVEEPEKNKFNFNFGDLGKFFENIGNVFNPKKNSKSKKLVAALPFLDSEDIHEIVEEILKNSEEYKDLDLVQVMPFLSQKDCDKLFMRLVVANNYSSNKIASIGPFISQECLSKLVDEYVNGNFQYVEIDALYQFMNSKDVKRLFKYIISKKEQN